METWPSDLELERALYSQSLSDFMRSAWPQVEPGIELRWHYYLDAISEFLEALTKGEFRNGAVAMPPGFAKSMTGSVLWPAWVWTHSPSTRFIYGSYAHHFVLRDAVKQRDLVRSDWYQERWPLSLVDAADTKGYFRNEYGGHRFAASITGQGTGERGDILVADDPMKAQDAYRELARSEVRRWWRETMSSRFADPKTGRRLIIAQRLHEDDLVGWAVEHGYAYLVLSNEYNPNARCVVPEIGWEDPRTVEGELLFPDRFGPEETAAMKADQGSYAYAAQYNQQPAPDDGSAWFPADWWQLWVTLPKNPDGTLRRPDDAVMSWDMTFTGRRQGARGKGSTDPDYVVGQLWYRYGAETFLIAQVRGQWTFAQTKVQMVAFDDRCRQGVDGIPFAPLRHVVETKANGEAILSDLRPVIPGLIGFNPDPFGDKVSRALAVQPRVEAQQVWLPGAMSGTGMVVPAGEWVSDFIHEMRVFPNGKNDDCVDTFSQAHLVMPVSSGWGAV